MNLTAPFLYSIVGASIGGAVMAVINVFAEIIRGDSIFKMRDLFHISLWHIFIWLLFGAGFGIIITIFHLLWPPKKTPIISHYVYFYVFFAFWLFTFGYLNILFFAGFVNTASIIMSQAIIWTGIILLIFLLKKLRSKETRQLPLALRICIVSLLTIVLVSSIFDKVFPLKRKPTEVSAEENQISLPNVILIVLDAVRYDHLSCYGYKKKTTANIDRLAEEGILFENAFAPSSHTIQSVPSLLSSCYPSTHKIITVTSAVSPRLVMLPEIFKSRGYRTSVFSVNPYVSVSHGYGKGVDDFYGLEETVIKVDKTVLGYMLNHFPLLPALERIFQSISKLSHSLFSSGAPFQSFDPKFVTQRVMKWLSERGKEPFFAYIHFDGAHGPYLPPESCWKLFDPHYQGKPVNNYPKGWGCFLPFLQGKPLPERDVINMIAHYDGEIYYHDQFIGELQEHLSNLELGSRTLIVITADHGEAFYEHKAWGHSHSLYEELIRVPLIFWCPGLIPKESRGKRVAELVGLVDVFPTILSLCGIDKNVELAYEIDGLDLSPLILDKGNKPSLEYVFAEFNQGKNSARCVRTKNFKAIDIRFGLKTVKMLFDLEKDPVERKNIYDEGQQAGAILFGKMDSIVKKAEEKAFKPRKIVVDEKLRERMRSLGYIK